MKTQTLIFVAIIIFPLFGFAQNPDNFPGTALDFDGTDDYVNIPDDNSLNSNSFTTEFWFKPDSLRIQHLVSKQDPGGGGLYWRIFMASANGSIEFDAYPGEIANCTATNIAQVGEWIHIAAVYDYASSTVRLYADGVLKSEVTGITDMGSATGKGLTFSRSYSPFDGCMDEVRYWNIALTGEQIRENMYLPLSGTETGLVSYWQFNDGSGTILTDNLNTNNGTLSNMTSNDWKSSSIPFGPGYADTETEANGTVNFNNTGLSMYFNSQNGAEITVTRIDTVANVNPAKPETIFDDQYWIVNRYGTGSFNTDLTFTISEDLTEEDESYPQIIKLYSRGSTADTAWTLLASASSVDIANNTATFTGIIGFSQFIIVRDNPQVTLYDPFNFDLVTNNFNSIDVGDFSYPTFTDIDGDGLLDMIVGEWDGNLNYYEQDSENSTSFTLITENFNSIVVGLYSLPSFTDLDGDGLLDMIVGERDGNLNYYEQDAHNSTSFTLVTENFNSIDVGYFSLPSFTDLDGDGLLDMIVGEGDGSLNYYEQDAQNSTSFTLVTENFNSIDVGSNSALTFTDLDDDGLLDMIVGEFNGNLNYYEQDSENSTSFSLVTGNFNSIDVGYCSTPTFTDLDRNGLLDMIVGEDDGNLNYYEQQEIDTLDFAKRLIGLNAVKSYYLKARDLINDLDINCSGSGFSISQSENSGYSQNLTITPANGIVFDIIFVKFSPTQENSYTGNIEHTSNGAQTQSIVLSGTGYSIDNFPGNALDFDGIDDYVNIGNDHSLNVGNTLTIEAWVKPNSLINQYGIFSTGIDNRAGSFQLEVGHGNGGTNRVAVTSPATWVAQTGDNAIIPNIWNHIVYTRSGTGSGTHKIYVNGEEQTLISDADYSFADNIDDKVIASATNGVQLFTGKIDEVRLWNIVRTESEIRENMYLPLSGLESGLVSYWQFNEGSETSASDLISGNYGTLTNMTVDDWISSSIPFGPGYTDTETETNGTVAFSNTGLSMNFSSQNGAEITVTRIDTIPNINPDISGTVFDSQYWVVNRYGNGSFDADLTFTISEDLTAEYESYNAKIKLYTRDSNADTYWEYLGDASSVSAADNTATFTGITLFSQFIIIRDDPQINLSDPSDFELVTDNFSSIDVGDYATPGFTNLDGDRLLDMIVGEENGNLNYYEQDTENSTSFTLVTNSFNSINVGYNSAPTFTDLDGDGLLDMIVGEGGNLHHYEQDAENSTSFTLVTNNFSSLNLEGNSTPTFTDIDGDGLLDLIVGRWSPKLYHYEQNAVNSTSFTLVSDYFNSLYVGYNNTPTFTDVDGDGLLDLLVGDDYGRLHHFEQDSENSSSFSLVTDYLNSIDVVGSTAPTFTDLFGDGKLDLILGISTGKLYHYEQLGIDSLSFGNQLIGQNTVKSYTLRASDLINDLNINCSGTCFSISLTENSGYSQSISITPVNGRVTEKIFVKFSPTQEITYTETIAHTSDLAEIKSIPLSGTGYRIDSFPGTALEFDGIDDYVNIGNNTSLNTANTLTIEAWIKPTDLSTRQGIYSTRKNNSSGSFQFEVGIGNGGTSRVAVSGVNTWIAQTGDNAIVPNEWNHIVYTRSGTGSGTHKIYVNGEEQTLISDADYTFINNSDDKVMASGTSGGNFYTGLIDEVRIWNTVRTSQQIRENMCRTLSGSETGLISYWQFNDGSGTTTVDLISGNDGTLTNMTIDDWVNSTAPVPFESSGDGNWSEASNWLSGQGYPATPWARAKVNSNLTLNQDFEMLELQVPIGKSLTLPPGKGLTITDTIDNKAGPSGIVLKSDATGQATLIQTSDSVDATVERYLTQGAYHYISSPVSNQNISTEFVDASSNPLPSTVDFYRFDEPANMWRNIKDGSGNLNNSFETQFVVSRGYAYANSNAVFTKNFSGELNYDDLTVTLTKQGSSANNGWNMVGNIYPANLAANTSADVDHNFLTDNATALDDNHEAIYLYDGNDYVAVNQASAESYIAPTQGFFVKAATNQAQLAFNAADQKHTTATFYKNGSTDSRFTIRITNPQSETNEILLAFIPGKSQGLDPGYDAQKLKGNSNLALYSLLVDDDGNDYAIQSLPQVDNQHVKLGLDAAQPGLYEFGNIAMENLNYSTIFLEDKTENLWVNLDLNPSYQFTLSQTGSFKDRFVLHFGGIVTNMEELSEERNITIFSDGDFIFLQNLSSEKQAGSFQLYNLAGQLLVNRELAIEAHSRVSVPTHCAAGMYLVSLLNTKKVYTQKVILK